jgi:threonine dehydrogenase-like Zn-dependent dehydrogenase
MEIIPLTAISSGSPVANACCSPAAQASCCAPSDKDACCGVDNTACGCTTASGATPQLFDQAHLALPVAVIGAGPVGLAAAAHLAARRQPFVLIEAGDVIGASVRQWGHVRLFSPWQYLIDPAAADLLSTSGWVAPPADAHPTGAELVRDYLDPLAALAPIRDALRLNTRVVAVARLGYSTSSKPAAVSARRSCCGCAMRTASNRTCSRAR